MAFDPNLPKAKSKIRAVELRDQFNGLKADYEAQIAAIPAGPQGPPGPPFATAIVDAVSTLGPDDAATVSASFDGNNVHFTFGLPRGHDGAAGADGATGAQGPQGEKGDKGETGEVSNQQLNDAINGTANNINSIAPLSLSLDDPPTAAQLQTVIDKVNEVINGLHR